MEHQRRERPRRITARAHDQERRDAARGRTVSGPVRLRAPGRHVSFSLARITGLGCPDDREFSRQPDAIITPARSRRQAASFAIFPESRNPKTAQEPF